MKKLPTLIAACALSATVLGGCAAHSPKYVPARIPERSPTTERVPEEPITDPKISGKSDIGESEFRTEKLPIDGVIRRLAKSAVGVYTVEYIHTPNYIDKDETLDYRLRLNDDHTFDMIVVSDGVQADHFGHWYKRHDEIMMFYDESTDPTAHNVYVADSMYGDMISSDRIMIYDNGYIIVLVRESV